MQHVSPGTGQRYPNPPLIDPPQAFTADPIFRYVVFGMIKNTLMNATGTEADNF